MEIECNAYAAWFAHSPYNPDVFVVAAQRENYDDITCKLLGAGVHKKRGPINSGVIMTAFRAETYLRQYKYVHRTNRQ